MSAKTLLMSLKRPFGVAGLSLRCNPASLKLPNRGVSRVARELPNLSKPDIRDAQPINRNAEMKAQNWPTRGIQPVASNPLNKHFMDPHPTTAGVDGEVRTFTPLPGWAVGLTSGRAACRSKPALPKMGFLSVKNAKNV